MRSHPAIDGLRAQIARIERTSRQKAAVLAFGVAEIDALLPGGGLALGGVHEVMGAGRANGDSAASVLFCAGLAARAAGPTLWCVAQADLFAPGLAQAGLQPDQVIFVQARSDKALLACCEEGLRHGGLGAVVAELSRLPMIASRRLQLAAESSGTLGLVLQRWEGAQTTGEPNAAHTRWRIAALPSSKLPTHGIGRARWHIELLRSRNGATGIFEVEACDAKGRLAVPAELAHRPALPRFGRERAAG